MTDKQKPLDGMRLIVPLSTPLDENEVLDVQGLKKLTDHVIDGGAEGIFILGSCGEGPCFNTERAQEIIEQASRAIRGRVPLLVGVGRNSTAETIELAEFAKRHGASHAVILPPTYFGIPNRELIEHYKKINVVGIPIVLYNLRKATQFEPDVVREIAQLENVVAMKDSTGNLDRFEKIAEILPTYQGDDSLILESLERGAVGCVPGLANIFPDWFKGLVTSYNEGRLEDARNIQERVTKTFNVIYKKPSNAQVGVKLGLERLGICSARMRSPNGQADDDSREAIYEFMKSIQH